ncbi:hypothetical protein ACQ4WX_34855 [Streptomyces lasalocidi]
MTGVRVRTPDGEVTVRAAVTVAADGRFSKVRELSGLPYEKLPLDRDVIWPRLPFPGQWDGHTCRIRIRARASTGCSSPPVRTVSGRASTSPRAG